MKKLITLIALLAIAGIVSADVVDGDLSGTGFVGTTTQSMNKDLSGWQAYPTRTVYDAANDRVAFGMDGSKSMVTGMGQVLLASAISSGDTTFNVSYDIADAGENARLYATVWGSDDWDWNESIQLSGIATAPRNAGSAVLGTIDLGSIGTASGTATTTLDLSGLAGYQYIQVGVSISKVDGTGSDHGYITNVEIVPEPATVGMLGLGALVALLVRRIRA